jgi:phosphoserine phosphatase RsbU/P
MRVFRLLPKPLLVAPAMLFALAAIFYSGFWIFYSMRGVPVELGFDNTYIARERCQLVRSVVRGSPAERAGLKPGDRIIRIYGDTLEAEDSLTRVWVQHKSGDAVDLTVQRAGTAVPLVIHATFRASSSTSSEAGLAHHLGQDVTNLFPVAFLTVGLAVLFLRLEDPNAWILALMFGSFIAIPGFPDSFMVLPPSLRLVAVAYRGFFNNMVAAFFYFFFAIFPTRSPLDRHLPWLKWFALVAGAALALRVSLQGTNASLGVAVGALSVGYERLAVLLFNYGLLVLGFVSLTWNAVSVESSEARRKIRVILWGTLVGVVPATLAVGANDFFGFHMTLSLAATIVLLLWLFPLSFAYAVVKHRVLEIPVLLRRSARYLLVQRGFVFLLVLLSGGVSLAFALYFGRYVQPLTGAAAPGGIALGTVFGTLLLWSGARVHKDVGGRIDRAFFRNAYDARLILEDLLEKTRTATDRNQLAALLGHHVKQALQPSSLAIYLENGEGQLAEFSGAVPREFTTISGTDPTLVKLARHGRPWDISGEGSKDMPTGLSFLRPDCLVPVQGRDGRLVGVVALGSRLSEEAYSNEDKHLLASVAGQAGIALESIRLGEKIAERIEVERRAAQEMEFARQVQARLFPQKLPPMKSLEYVGGCIPARTVGGDYYDFLELRSGRLALVLADIAGKGVPGALLMANLQANLRSQYAMAVDDLPRLLASVNRLFYQTTDNASYATLFFADYDDETRLIRYANCGHLPAILLRGGGAVEWLPATCTVLGLFEQWRCEVAEVRLDPGDTLVLYTDGITEAIDADEEEFGEARLVEILGGQCHLPVGHLLEAVVMAARQFSGGKQQDDLTLVIARCVA